MFRRRPHPLALLRDLFVYAPLGFLVESPRLVPELIVTGRQWVSNVRTIGRRGPAAHDVAAVPHPVTGSDAGADIEEISIEVVNESPQGSSAAEALLVIPGYDQLAASQVVARLGGLSPAELDRVEAYELEHRQRRTILGKISQIRGR